MITARPSLFACGLSVLVLLGLGIAVTAQEKSEPAAKEETKADDPERAELEKGFRDMLTNATLTGRWRLVEDGVLGKEREEKYSITGAAKVGKDIWLITARIQYGGKDVTVPVPVKVLWAGDTPIITVTDLGVPGLGTYTARVMFYRNLYTGTWFGPGHGGLMSGSIVKTEAAPEGEAGKDVGEKNGE